jgi:serine/threonine protein kinase/DNA-binding winged helix-turn-helix (wHTH) protein/tetratricopeptide (TPR) repeat protein
MKDPQPYRVRFGVFELDLKSGELRNSDEKMVLREQSLQILRMMIERGGEIVTREEIRKKLWPNDTIVEFDHSINVAINKLRKALDDSADEPQYIATVARRGYRLMVRVEWVPDSSDPIPTLSPKPGDQGGAPAEVVLRQPEPGTLTGRTVSHYRVLDIIDGGGMGVVYRAEDLRLGRRVALKVLPEELGSDAQALERFSREARAASALDHPNICSIYQFGEHEGQPFIVMQLLEGQTLRDRLRSAGALPLGELLDIGIQVSEGLQAAHEKGIIHRDIKPANIFITRKGVAKILDFGLAKLLAGDEDDTAAQPLAPADAPSTAAHPTRNGFPMGTAGYMSPEQVRGEKLDPRSDLFSFGLILYEMATGRRAFGGETAIVQDAIVNTAPVPVNKLDSALPAELGEIITKALQKEPEQRFQHASEIKDRLKKLQRESGAGVGLQEVAAAGALQTGPALGVPKLSTTDATPTRSWVKWASLALAALAIAGAGLWYWRWQRARTLTAHDTIVVADFVNSTGDATFDDALKVGLFINLLQSPSIKLLSEPKVNGALKLMNRPANQRLTSEVAREVCLRTNSTAVLESSIADEGNRYRIALKVVNCHTQATLASTERVAESRDQIVRVLGEAGYNIRAQLGEPRASLQEFNHPLDEAASPSPEALQAFTLALRAQTQGPSAALPYLKRAVELDPNFVAAYTALGDTYESLGEAGLAVQNLRAAYELRNRVSSSFRFAIETHYYTVATGELEKAVQTYSEWNRTHPGAGGWVVHNNVGELYMKLGQYQKSAGEEQESIRLMPDNAQSYNNLILDYIALNRLDEAQAAFAEAGARKVDEPYMRATRYLLAFLQKDSAGMQEQLAWARGKPGIEDVLLSCQSDTEAYYGRLGRAREFSQSAVESARQSKAPETMASWRAREALREAEIGNTGRAREMLADASRQATGRDADLMAAVTLARIGEVSQAQNLVDKLDREFPLDTLIQGYWLPTILAVIELQRGNPERAIVELRAASNYELSEPPSPRSGRVDPMYPVYVRGLAYLKADKGQEEAAEFQRMLDHPGVMLNFVTGALAHLQLGRAQAMMGDNAAARKSYQDFLTLWKDADPDIPIYKQAKAEFARLR